MIKKGIIRLFIFLILPMMLHSNAWTQKSQMDPLIKAQFALDQGQADSAIFWIESLSRMDDLSDLSPRANLLLGKAFQETGPLDSASLFLLRARSKSGGNVKLATEANINLGSVYGMMRQFDPSLFHFKEAFDMASINGDSVNMAKSLLGLGNIFYFDQEYDSAISNYTQASRVLSNGEDQKAHASSLLNVAEAFRSSEQYDSALVYTDKAIELYTSLSDTLSLAHVYHNQGLLLFNLEDYEASLDSYTTSLVYSERADSKWDIEKAWFGLSMSYGELGDFRAAFDFLNRYQSSHGEPDYDLIRSTYNIKLNDVIDNWSTKLSLASAQMRTVLSIGIAILITVLLLIIIVQRKQNAQKAILLKNQQLANQKIDELLQKQEINSLQGVLAGQEEERKRIATDLHDRLGATLGMVKLHFTAVEERIDLLREDNKNQYNKATELLDQAYSEVRSISHDLVSGVLVKFGLGPALTDLKDKLESTGKLKVQLVLNEMSERLKGEVELQIYRIIQELVSNILKHAQATEAVIQLNRTNNHINLIVEDNGVGFDPEVVKEKEGIGMHNLEARVDQLNASIHFDSGKGAGTTVSIDIPLEDKIY